LFSEIDILAVVLHSCKNIQIGIGTIVSELSSIGKQGFFFAFLVYF
jgi:hypothetical protein